MTITVTREAAEMALTFQERAAVNRAKGYTEAADQLEALARSMLKLPRYDAAIRERRQSA